MHGKKNAALTLKYFKVLTYKDFVPTFCEIAGIWVFTNCQCDV